MKPYYDHDGITIYHGDATDLMETLTYEAEYLVTDPPYGIAWKKGLNKAAGSRAHAGIRGDADTTARNQALAHWLVTDPHVVFGSFAVKPPPGVTQTLVWKKPADAGVVGCVTGFRRDIEAIYLCGKFPSRTSQWSSVMTSSVPNIGGSNGPAGRAGHPHAKPLDLMARLIELAPGTIIDPFCGSGSTLRAAKDLGRKAIGIEIEERYCEIAAQRLGQEVLDFGAAA